MNDNYNYVLLLATLLSGNVLAVNIDASNDWSSCQLQNTITQAGDYYSSTLSSDEATLSCDDAFLTITGVATSTTSWSVSTRLVDSLSGMNLELRRSGNGTGDSTPSGGDSYTTLSTAPQAFFSGQGNVSSIPLQFRIRNFDVSAGNGSLNLQIQYQITTN